LPTIKIKKKEFFIDKRLNQIRNVKNPSDYEDVSVELINYWLDNKVSEI
jgi:hypothetical protein